MNGITINADSFVSLFHLRLARGIHDDFNRKRGSIILRTPGELCMFKDNSRSKDRDSVADEESGHEPAELGVMAGEVQFLEESRLGDDERDVGLVDLGDDPNEQECARPGASGGSSAIACCRIRDAAHSHSVSVVA
jgi:hypothetical protein